MENGQALPVKLGGYECIGSPVLIVDPQTAAILDANESACKFYGYSHTDFIQKKILDLAVIPADEAWQRIRKIAAGEITHMTLQHRLSSGEICDVEVDLGRGLLDHRTVNIATIHDVTEREHAKKISQKSKENYHLLFQNMREGFALYEVITDAEGKSIDARILSANAAYEHHTGLKPLDVIGRTILEVRPQTALSQLEPYFKVAQTGEPISSEYFSTAFQRHFRIKAFCPQPGQFASIVEDITERKQAEKALRESEERFSTIFHSSHDSISIHRLKDNIFLDVNEAFSTIFGLTREQIIGHEGREFYTPLDPAEREEMMRSLRSQGQFIDFEAQFHNRQGQAGYLLLSGKVINISGEECLLLFGKDITLRKQAEAALQSAHNELELRVQERTGDLRRVIERLDLATDAAKMGIWDWDVQKNELIWDRQMYTLYGVKPEDFSGAYEAWLNGVHPDDRETSDQASEQARKGNRPYDTEFRVLWPDGSMHWLKADGQVYWDEQGKPIRMLGVNYDITERKQAEEQIQESERRFRSLFENSAVTMLLIEPSTGMIVNANPAAANFYGYSRGQLLSMNINEINLLSPEEVTQEMRLAKERRRNYFIFPHRLASGEVRTVEVRSNPIVMSQSTLLFSFVYDVTEKIKIEKQLHEHQFRTEMAVRGGNVGTWEWNVQTGETVFNERWAEIVGYTLQELEPISIQTWIDLCHPDDLKYSDELLKKYFIGESNSYECELRIKHKNGSWVWVFDSGRVMDYTEDGKPLHMFGTHLDITKSKHLENELRESEKKFTTLFEKSSVPSLLFRLPEIIIENVNEAFEEMSGYQRWELLGKNVVEIGLAPQAQYAQTVAKFYEQDFITKRETLYFTKSGKERTILLNINPVSLRNEPYAIATSVDITERKKAEEELITVNSALEKALHTKDEFLAAMSHELRTPINGIMGMTELLQVTAANTLSDKQIKYLTNIEKNGKRLLDMVNNVLEYSQLQGRSLKLDIRPCVIDELCRNALQKITSLAEAKQQDIRFFTNPSNIKAAADEYRLLKILSLLLDNASKFTATGGEFGIDVQGRMETGLLEITVWDTGIGIAENDLPRLFKPFVQLDASLARQYEGAGLGLALAKGLTELIGGNLTVQSTLGKGSRFAVILPWR